MIFKASFWKAAGERAIKTFAQALASLLIASDTGLLNADWLVSLSVAGMAGLVSILTSIGTGAVTDGSPSLAGETLAGSDDRSH